jgi:hypothetical protein
MVVYLLREVHYSIKKVNPWLLDSYNYISGDPFIAKEGGHGIIQAFFCVPLENPENAIGLILEFSY